MLELQKMQKLLVEKKDPEVYKFLNMLRLNHPVLLNRAPTLHRLVFRHFSHYLLMVELLDYIHLFAQHLMLILMVIKWQSMFHYQLNHKWRHGC